MRQEITTERGREIRIHVRVLLEWRHATVSKWLQLSLPAGSTRQLTKQKYKNLNGNSMKFDDDPITSLAEKLNLQETRIFVMFLQNCVICQRQFLPHTHTHKEKNKNPSPIHHQVEQRWPTITSLTGSQSSKYILKYHRMDSRIA